MKDLLNAFPNRDYTSLVNMASRLNLHSEVNRHRLGDLSFLDLDNLTKKVRIDEDILWLMVIYLKPIC